MSGPRDTHRRGGASPAPTVGSALSGLRWAIVATMLLIVVAWAVPGRTGHQLWPLIVAFAGYNLLVELVRHRMAKLRSFAWVPAFDRPVAGLLYFLDAEPVGPLFVSFCLAVVTADACWPLRRTMPYLAAVVAAVVVVVSTLPRWASTPGELRQLAARLGVLIMVGVGTAVLTQRLARQEDLARTMREEAARLEALDRLRTDVVASVSHDLRTPLTAALAGLGMLDRSAGERLRPDERQLLGNDRRSVERLGTMIDDILTVAQLEAGVLRRDCEPLDLGTAATDAMTTVHPLTRQKGQAVEIDLPEPLPVVGDERRLEQVMVNFLANAHRHTSPGTRIAVTGRAGPREVRLTVADDGPGIPQGELERIFERFHRAGPGGGTGLGLYSVRRFVELHGGRLWAESGAGTGAAFHLALPRDGDGDERGQRSWSPRTTPTSPRSSPSGRG